MFECGVIFVCCCCRLFTFYTFYSCNIGFMSEHFLLVKVIREIIFSCVLSYYEDV